MAADPHMPDRSRRPFSLPEARAILARTPALLDLWLRGLPPGWLDANEGEGTWSPYVVVGHLIHGEVADWIPRLERMLEHGTAVAFDKFDREAQFRESAGKSLDQLLDELAERRADNLRRLDELMAGEASLDRRGRHPALGEVTVRELLATWVAHDLDHVIQIARVMGRQYSDEVGPWRAYLRIISGQPG
jgi:hypothetical protein